VLDAVAESAARLCSAYDAVIFRLDGDVLRRAAHTGPIPAPPGFAIPTTRSRVTGRAVLDRQPVHIADAQAKSDEFPETRMFALEHGFRTILSVPLLREGLAIGTIDLRRTELQPFTGTQIALLQTFAAQAVIAIENVRLFNETKEALEQQTATSEILRVISSSPTDIQPVFDAIARSAAVLCGSSTATVFRLEGGVIDLVAHHGGTREWLALVRTLFPADARERPVGWVALQRATLHFADIENDPRATPEFRAAARALGFRRGLLVPMQRGETPLGVIGVGHAEPGPFSDRQIALLETFADQAVIAIENVRLFKELQTKNQDLTTSLDQQTATSEILRVIASSPTNLQPVMDTVAENAARVCGATD